MQVESYSDANNYPVLGQWKLVKQLGSGATSQVYLAIDPATKQQAAIKIFTTKEASYLVEAEAEFLQEFSHSNILGYIDSDSSAEVYDPVTGETREVSMIAMEYAPRELFDYLQQSKYLPEETARKIFKQLIDAISHLHEKKIVHRDIKLDNILLDDQFNVKLADFGYSSHFQPGRLYKSAVGTSSYFAPEIHENRAFSPEKADLFAAGLVLFALVTGHMPFLKADMEDQAYKMFMDREKSTFWKLHYRMAKKQCSKFKMSQDFIDLMEKMLNADPKKRLSIQEINNHSWMKADLSSSESE